MTSFRIVTQIDAPPAVCFDLARSIDLHLETMASSKERAVAGVTTGLIGNGEEVTWEAVHFGIRWRMTSRITEFEPPHRFVDEMASGPFASFRHEHRFDGDATTRMTDQVALRGGRGMLGLVPSPLVGAYLQRLVHQRALVIKSTAERKGDRSR